MKKKTLSKHIQRSITGSLGRFLSIFSLMFLGVFIFIGLKVAGPDMRATAEDFFEKQHLADFTILSTYGLDETDEDIIRSVDDVNHVEFGYFQDALIQDTKTSIRIFSEPKTLSTYELISGKMPKNDNEIVLDFLYQDEYELGDTIIFSADDNETNQLKNHNFEIVGFVKSSEFLGRKNYGKTNIGTGQLNGYAVVTDSLFDSELYSIARLTFEPMEALSPYSETFTSLSDKYKIELESLLGEQSEDRLIALKASKKAELDNNLSKLNDRNAEIQKKQELLNSQIQSSTSLGISPPAEVKNAMEELEKAKQDIDKNLAQIKESENKLDTLPAPVYSINDRKKGNPGYETFLDNSTRIDILSNVFPVVLFAVATFVCLTTMTRFVEEERSNLGLLKALGYTNRDIRRKFLIYGFVSGTLGTLTGIWLGHIFLPNAVFRAYTSSSTISDLILNFSFRYSLLAFAIAISCTVIPVYIVTHTELESSPASLFLAKPPKAGSRILLEKIGFIWNCMPFSYKVTARNIFRYKQRMIMTIIGVAGATALLVMGFGIRDSIAGLGQRQFGDILHYHMLAISDSELSDSEKSEQDKFVHSDKITSFAKIYYEPLTAKTNETTSSISMIVPEDISSFSDFVTLQNRSTGEKIDLDKDKVIISEKLANLLQVEAGDTIKVKNSNQDYINFEISSITQMYMGHYIFMTPEAYKSNFNEENKSNAYLLKVKENSTEEITNLATEFMDTSGGKAILINSSTKESADSFLKSINSITMILLACAILLTFVVIYNLTNLNVSERIRELSTIKVLGFYDHEVTLYIYQETVFLSLIGVLFGFFLGAYFHNIIITKLPLNTIMFNPELLWTNLSFSAFVIIATTFILSFVVHEQLKHVDMLAALKSID